MLFQSQVNPSFFSFVLFLFPFQDYFLFLIISHRKQSNHVYCVFLLRKIVTRKDIEISPTSQKGIILIVEIAGFSCFPVQPVRAMYRYKRTFRFFFSLPFPIIVFADTLSWRGIIKIMSKSTSNDVILFAFSGGQAITWSGGARGHEGDKLYFPKSLGRTSDAYTRGRALSSLRSR